LPKAPAPIEAEEFFHTHQPTHLPLLAALLLGRDVFLVAFFLLLVIDLVVVVVVRSHG
jgi:hypothetical protein